MRLVLKYGGTSLSSAKSIRDIARFVSGISAENEVIVVCSAIRGVTDSLIDIAGLVSEGDREGAKRAATRIMRTHRRLAGQVASDPENRTGLLASLKADFDELAGMVDGMALLSEITPRSRDHLLSFGERLSIKIVSHAIADLGTASQPVTGADAGIVTDSNFGESKPLMDTTKLRVSKTVGGILSRGSVPVVGGFAGADQHGRITTFGRGGSDYTATIVGTCMQADQIWLMTDVDGLMTADPRIVSDAIVLREVSYPEAIEMALFGAKQIHPRTFEPLLTRKIPMRIRSSRNTSDPGTLLTSSPGPATKKTVKSICLVRHNGLVDIRGGSMVGLPGTAAKIFTTLADVGINVMMISQSPSESSITIVVKNADLERAVGVLEMELLGRIIKKLEVTTDVAIVALIGSGMRGTVGVASRVFGSIAQSGISVAMITQGSSELNLAFVVREADAESAVGALHREFDLAAIN
jgi:aspartate kinase